MTQTKEGSDRKFLSSLAWGFIGGIIAAMLTAAATVWVGVATNVENARLSAQAALSSAMNAIGGSSPAQRAAGVSVARSLAIQELTAAENPELLIRLTGQDSYNKQEAIEPFRL
jgi:hypothetical protein